MIRKPSKVQPLRGEVWRVRSYEIRLSLLSNILISFTGHRAIKSSYALVLVRPAISTVLSFIPRPYFAQKLFNNINNNST